MTPPVRILVVGEGMVEISWPPNASDWQHGYGGDSLNTAIHLARFGRHVTYATALGADTSSDYLRSAWAAEGIDTSLILIDPEREPGRYTIHTDAQGERSFIYQRSDSAARGMFTLPGSEHIAAPTQRFTLLYYSLISLAILPPEDREKVLTLARRMRAKNGLVAFDSNYRPHLWRSNVEARAVRDAALACCDIGFPTFEDEYALSGLSDAQAVARHWTDCGVKEVIVKLGAQGCRIPDGRLVPPASVAVPIDTSGAGDAFNAGYMHARLNNASFEVAAATAHRLAEWVLMRSGAIPASTSDAPYWITEENRPDV